MNFEKEVEIGNIEQWVEYYRPDDFESILLPTNIRNYFKTVICAGNLRSIILHSRKPGSGKTSLAKLICNTLDYEYKYINSSKERSLSILRNDIARFASSKSLTGKMKCAILDEFDGVTTQFQRALKVDIEKYSNKCRFILITNEVDSIDEKLLSRCQNIDMNFQDINEEYEEMLSLTAGRVKSILNHRKVEFDPEAIGNLIINRFPDIRDIINTCEEFYTKFGAINANVITFNTLDTEFINLMRTKKISNVRKYLAGIKYNYQCIFNDLDRLIFSELPEDSLGNALIITHDYMTTFSKSIDKEITCSAFIQEIMGLI